MDWLTQHLTDEEKQKIIFESREKERLEEVTVQVTEKAIKNSYELLLEVGTPSEQAIKAIASKNEISESNVRKILEKN